MYKQRIANLMRAAKNEKEDLDFIESRMEAFTEYQRHVVWMETRIQRIEMEGLRGEDYRNAVEPLDHARRSKHNVAMDAINQLNRMSQMYGLEPFYDGPVDHEHRNQVGDVIGDIVNEYFQGRNIDTLKAKDLTEGEKDFTDAVASIPGDTPSSRIDNTSLG